MKKITLKLDLIRYYRILRSAFVIFSFLAFNNIALADELITAAATGTNTTNISTYTEIVSVDIDVTNVTKVLVYATFTSQSTQNETVRRTLTFQLSDNAETPNTSNEIIRHLAKSREGDYGIGTLFYIFDVTGSPTTRTYTLKHKVDRAKNTETSATIVVMALNTDVNPYPTLNTDMRAITTAVTSTSASFEVVAGLTTNAIPLPVTGGFLVAASINCYSDGTSLGEWGLQMQKDGGDYSGIGNSIQRSIATTDDYGIITLLTLLPDQPSGDYNFQVVHKKVSGSSNIITFNTTLVAVALGYENEQGGRSFAVNTNTTGSVGPTSATSAEAALTLSSVIAKGTSVLLLSQFGTQASNATTASFSLTHTGTGGAVSSNIMQRYSSGIDDRGAGGTTGLVTGLTADQVYDFTINHWTSASSITTTNIMLGAIQLTDIESPGYWTGATDNDWAKTTNWYDGVLPASSTNITLYDAINDPIVSTSDATCNNLDIITGNLTISSSGDLRVSGTLTNTDNTKLVIQSTSESLTGSLIHASGIPNATIERYIPQNGWHLVTPVTIPTTANEFYLGAANRTWFAELDESTNVYSYITDEYVPLNRAKGYSYWIDIAQGAQTIEFTGTLISEDVVAPLTKSTSPGKGWNLIGNPFPSAIDWTGVTAGISTGTAYVWDNSSSGYLYSITGNGINPAPNVGTLPDDIIPLGQGFLVQATSTGDFTIPKSSKTHNTASFIKSTNDVDNKASQFVRIDLDGGHYGNTVFIGFPENGTGSFDTSGDATKLYSSTENIQFFALENNDELCVNANSPLTEDENKTVPLNLVQITDGDYIMGFSDLDQLQNADIILEDLKTGITQDIHENPAYPFNGLSGDNPERFLLHFTWSPNDINENIEDISSSMQIYSFGNEVYIRSKDEAINQSGLVFVYDLMGRELSQHRITGYELVKFHINTSNSYVVVKVVKGNLIKTQSMFIK